MTAPHLHAIDLAVMPRFDAAGGLARAAAVGLQGTADVLGRTSWAVSPVVQNRGNEAIAGVVPQARAPVARAPETAPAAGASLHAGTEPAPKLSRSEQARINGAKSRGPKTPQGKAVSSRNATTHGLTASYCVLIDGEDPAEFEAFVADYHHELRPMGTVQSSFVQRAAELAWRLRRMPMLEATILSGCAGEFGQEKWLNGWSGQICGDDGRDGVLLRLQRYESRLERSLSMCLRELRQLQRQPVPAEEEPAAVEVEADAGKSADPSGSIGKVRCDSTHHCHEVAKQPVKRSGSICPNEGAAFDVSRASGSIGKVGCVSTHHRVEEAEKGRMAKVYQAPTMPMACS